MADRAPTSSALRIVLPIAILLCAAAPAMPEKAAAAPDARAAADAAPAGPTDPAELEAFLDTLLADEMAEHQVPGAAVAVVQDGALLLAKGYGHADLARDVPVDPERTVFRIGSVGKLLTWAAVMQRVEQGTLDLDEDINAYLDFRIPDTYPEPITLAHLMTHTAGFEDLYFEIFARDAADLLPVREWLVSHMPARVRPPGECAAYSNYGTDLAGYIVERASGLPYSRYVRERILAPLGMASSTAEWPLPPDLRARASAGYLVVDGALQAVPDEDDYSGQRATLPAGAHAGSAADMARFMIALLRDGRGRDEAGAGTRILDEATVRRMQGTLYTPDPRLLGTAHGLFDFSDNGQRTLGHSGSTLGFNTLLLLLPDRDLGVFVVYNAEEVGDLTRQHFGFQRAFFDHYFPAPAAPPIQPPADFAARAARFEGAYLVTRSAYTTLEAYRNLAGTIRVVDRGDGTLDVRTPWGDWRVVEVEPLYFRQVDGPFAMVFRADDRGRITHLFIEVAPQLAFERLAWHETPGFNLGLVAACLLVFLSVLAIAAFRAWRSARRGDDRTAGPRGARAAGWIIVGVCALNLLFVAGTVLWGNPMPFFGVPWIYRIVLGLGVLSAALTAGALVAIALAWRNGYWDLATRGHFTLAAVAAVAFVWFLDAWNLLGWRF